MEAGWDGGVAGTEKKEIPRRVAVRFSDGCVSPAKTIMSKKRIKDVKLKSGALTYEGNDGAERWRESSSRGGMVWGQEMRRDSVKEHIERSMKKERRRGRKKRSL